MKTAFRIALFSFALPVALVAQSERSLYTHPFGIQTYTYRNSFPNGIEATLDTIAGLGITEVETSVPKGVTLEAYKKMLNERGLSVPSTGAGYDELVGNTDQVIQRAKALGAMYIMTAWIPHERPFKIADAKKAVDDFNTAGKKISESGLTFCYHVHGYEFSPYEDGTLFDYIARNTDPRYVSFEMDIMWVFHGGADPAKLLEKYGDRWKLMHLKDLKKGVKGDNTGSTSTENDVTLGTGQLDIPGILRAAKKAGIKHYFIEDESSRIRTQVPQSIAFLKSLKE